MAIIKKKVMVKPMKKAKQGIIIPENPDQSNQLNKMKAETEAKLKRAKGIPINPQIRRDIRKGILDENGLYKKENDMKANMSRTPMKMGGAMAKQAAVAIAMKKAGKTPKKKMQYGGEAASMAPTMKKGGAMKKCKYGCK